METNNWRDIFDIGQIQEGSDLSDWEKIQAEIPELADVDLSTADFPTSVELNEIRTGSSSSGGASLFKSIGIFLGAVALVGTLFWYVFSRYQDYKSKEIKKEYNLAEHRNDPQQEPISFEDDSLPLEKNNEVDSEFYVHAIMETADLDRSHTDLNLIESRDLQPLFFQENKTEHRVSRYAPDYNYKYVLNYKVYNYEDRIASYESYELDGLAPKYSNWKDMSRYYHQPSMDYAAYDELLYKAMKYMHKERYREVDLILFSIIKSYPEDQNAWFYSGISSYRQGNYSEAKDCFAQVITLKSVVFRPEAEWYKSLCLLQIGEEDVAIAELKKIANSGGFYEKHAKDLLAKQPQ